MNKCRWIEVFRPRGSWHANGNCLALSGPPHSGSPQHSGPPRIMMIIIIVALINDHSNHIDSNEIFLLEKAKQVHRSANLGNIYTMCLGGRGGLSKGLMACKSRSRPLRVEVLCGAAKQNPWGQNWSWL